MKVNALLLLAYLLAFWGLDMALQNEQVYERTLGLFAKNWVSYDDHKSLEKVPYVKPSNDNYIHWDGYHYFHISQHGYVTNESYGTENFAFFPLFPLIWRLSGLPPLGILFLNFTLFALSLVLLLRFLPSRQSSSRIPLLLILLCLPSTCIFFIPYTESTFFITCSIGIIGLMREKYWLYFIGFFLAALTRSSFTVLLMALVCTEAFYLLGHRNLLTFVKQSLLRSTPLLMGTMVVAFIHSQFEGGGPFSFIDAHRHWNHVLSIPTHLRDWSVEGFGISIGAAFFISIPILIGIIFLTFKQMKLRNSPQIEHVSRSPLSYVQILSAFYLLGNLAFIILYQGGSIHGLFRYTLCNPFFYLLAISLSSNLASFPKKKRTIFLSVALVCGILVMTLGGYAGKLTFSDLGFILMLLFTIVWLYQDFAHSKGWRITLYVSLVANLVWITYMFNTYLANGWIFA